MKRRVPAFTIAELLVALAITSVLVVMLVSVVRAALNTWEQGRNQVDTFANARQALGRIADEIKGAIASPAPLQIEFSESVGALPGSAPPVPGTSENVFFVAPYPNSAAGDLCVIAYYHKNDTHELLRAFVDSQNAWIGAPKYRTTGYSSLQWRPVAQGVLEFEVQSYSQTDLNTSVSPTPSPSPWNSVGGTAAMVGRAPRQVVIRIKVVDDKTLARLNSVAAGPVYDQIVNRAAREFTAAVVLSH